MLGVSSCKEQQQRKLEGMDWNTETSSHLWIVGEIDLSGDVVDGTYPLEGKNETQFFKLTCIQKWQTLR